MLAESIRQTRDLIDRAKRDADWVRNLKEGLRPLSDFLTTVEWLLQLTPRDESADDASRYGRP